MDADDPADPLDPPFNLGEAEVGIVTSLRALAPGMAVLNAVPGGIDVGTLGGEGVWLAESSGSAGMSYTHVPYETGLSWGTTTCTEAEFFDWTERVGMALDPTSSGTGTVRAFVASQACGAAEVAFDALDPSDPTTTDWTALDLGACTLEPADFSGLEVSRDGRWLLVHGGANGGVCMLDRDSGVAEQAAAADEPDLLIAGALPHPHVDDTFFFGGHPVGGTSDVPGVYVLQRRYRPSPSDPDDWVWGNRRLSKADLEHRQVVDLDWGAGGGGVEAGLRHLYLATAGGGVWDLTVGVE